MQKNNNNNFKKKVLEISNYTCKNMTNKTDNINLTYKFTE